MKTRSEINYDQREIDSDEVGELFLGNDPSKLEPKLFNPVLSSSDKIEYHKACNICGN